MHTEVNGKGVPFPIIGKSIGLINLYDNLSLLRWRLEKCNEASHVLITGETGVGKEIVALLIGAYYDKHLSNKSKSQTTTFVKYNCAGLTEELAVSLLFGHKKGAATGLTEDRLGLIHEGATVLFLDEIQQIKGRASSLLLRFMQEGTYHILGDSTERRSSCKIIAATNRGDFVQENSKIGLTQRFQTIIDIPPLNDRREDIPALVQYFYDEHFKTGRGNPTVLNHLKQNYLQGWNKRDWADDNIRTLKNEVIDIIEKLMRDMDLRINITQDRAYTGIQKSKVGAPKKTCVIDYIKCLIDADPEDLSEFKDFWMENRIDRSYTFDALRKAIRIMKAESIESDEPAMVDAMINYFQGKDINDWLGTLKIIMDRFDSDELRECIDECNAALDLISR